jgi:branched-chain amino acid transport system permease protein
VMFILVGGVGTLLGPLVGTVLVTYLTQSLQFLQDYRMVVFGPVLIALIIFLPDGIVGTWLKRRAQRADAARAGRQPGETTADDASAREAQGNA